MSNDFLKPLWGEPARNRIAAALARYPGPFAVREIARLAHVSPSTALRVTDEFVDMGVLRRRKVTGRSKAGFPLTTRVLFEVKKDWVPKLRVDYAPHQTKAELLEFLSNLDAPVWVIDHFMLSKRGITRRVPTFVVIARSWAHRFRFPRDLPVAIFEEARPLERTTQTELPWVDLLIALLKVDPLAARQLYDSHRRSGISAKHRRTMLRRIRAEKLTEDAKAARIDLDLRRRKRSA